MIEYVLDSDAVPSVRFAISPLSEVGQSLKLLRAPHRAPFYAEWLAREQSRLPEADREVLAALLSEQLWTPDFLHPAHGPEGGSTFAAQLADLAATPGDALAQDFALLYPDGGLPAPLRGDPDRVRDRVVEALSSYWVGSFEAAWPAIRRCLEADLLYRGRRVTEIGLAAAMLELTDQVSLDGRRFVVRLRRDRTLTYRKSLGEAVLVMVPSVFTNRVGVPLVENRPPQVVYPARGRGNVWTDGAKGGGNALRKLLGPGKSLLLLLLEEPRTTVELSDLCSVTPSAVSQQLGVLTQAGLVYGTRSGRHVVYRRTEVGDALVESAGGGRGLGAG